MHLLRRQSEGGALAFPQLLGYSLTFAGSLPLEVSPTSFKSLCRMLAAEQSPIHDYPRSIQAPLDGAVRKFFLHEAPYGLKSVLIHYGIWPPAQGLDERQQFFRKRKPIVALM